MHSNICISIQNLCVNKKCKNTRLCLILNCLCIVELVKDGYSHLGTLTPNGSFSMGMIQKVGTSFNHVGGFQ